jgi:predicted nucleic acid-binding protein
MKKEPAVSNTSALLFLSKLNNIVFLKNIINDLIDEKYIEVIDIKNTLLARYLSHNLHSGESEAIVLAAIITLCSGKYKYEYSRGFGY